MKTMIYISEKGTSYGHKQVKFNFQKGMKIMSESKAIVCVSVVELGQEAHTLLNMEFHELSKFKISILEKADRLAKFAENYSGEEGNQKAITYLNGYNERFSNMLEDVLCKIENI